MSTIENEIRYFNICFPYQEVKNNISNCFSITNTSYSNALSSGNFWVRHRDRAFQIAKQTQKISC